MVQIMIIGVIKTTTKQQNPSNMRKREGVRGGGMGGKFLLLSKEIRLT